MKIEVIPFAGAVRDQSVEGKTVVVIDVLRATSVIITALQQGARAIIPCASVSEARQKASEFKPGTYLLTGERDSKRITGFHLGNSPLDFTKEMVSNKTIIMTTTNGTKALTACMKAKKIWIGAFLNLNAVVEKLQKQDEVVLVCSGTNGRFSMEDGLCAAAMIDALSKTHLVTTDDLGQLLLMTWQNNRAKQAELIENSFHAKTLIKMGFQQDVARCLQTNVIALTPFFNPKDGRVVAR